MLRYRALSPFDVYVVRASRSSSSRALILVALRPCVSRARGCRVSRRAALVPACVERRRRQCALVQRPSTDHHDGGWLRFNVGSRNVGYAMTAVVELLLLLPRLRPVGKAEDAYAQRACLPALCSLRRPGQY